MSPRWINRKPKFMGPHLSQSLTLPLLLAPPSALIPPPCAVPRPLPPARCAILSGLSMSLSSLNCEFLVLTHLSIHGA